ncbi:hypothetical protein GCM10020256_37320 [Streptomyces thermocoprophilus]
MTALRPEREDSYGAVPYEYGAAPYGTQDGTYTDQGTYADEGYAAGGRRALCAARRRRDDGAARAPAPREGRHSRL